MKKQLSINTYISSASSQIVKKSLSEEYTNFLDTCDTAWKTFQTNDSFNNNSILLALENSQDMSESNLFYDYDQNLFQACSKATQLMYNYAT